MLIDKIISYFDKSSIDNENIDFSKLIPTDCTEEKTIKILLLGEFNAGKSSLSNALLFKQILPVDIFQTTSTINRIKYSQKDFFQIIDHNNKVVLKDDNLENLKNFNADQGLFNNIKWIEIYTPVIPKDLEIIDTPGFNDPNPVRDKAFLSIAPEADVIIFISDSNQALKGSEIPYIQKYFLNNLNRIFFVFNQCDTLINNNNLSLFRTNISEAVNRIIEDSINIFSKYNCNEFTQVLKNLDINHHIFLVSADYENGKLNLEKIEKEFAEYLRQDFLRLREIIFSLTKIKSQINTHNFLNSLLVDYRDKYEILNSNIQILDELKNDITILTTSLNDTLLKQMKSFKEISEKIKMIPKELRKILEIEASNNLQKLSSRVSMIVDSGEYLVEDFLNREIQGSIQYLIDTSSKYINDNLNLSIDFDYKKVSLKDLNGTIMNTSAQAPNQNDYMLSAAKTTIVSTIAYAALGPVGALIGSVLGGLQQIRAIENQKNQNKEICNKLIGKAQNIINESLKNIYDTLILQLQMYEKILLKGTYNTQWKIIELIEYSMKYDESIKNDLIKKKSNIAILINKLQTELINNETFKL